MKIKSIIFTLIIISLSIVAFPQNCRTFAKKKCLPEILPYVHDGQYNVTTLAPGESAQMYMTFYSGQEYKVIACADDALGEKVILRIKDANNRILYDNSKNNYANWWSFNVKASQQLIIEVSVPATNNEADKNSVGCVSIMVGFMNTEKTIQKM